MVTTTHGAQLNRHFFIGAGAGVSITRYKNDEPYDTHGMVSTTSMQPSVPIFAAARWDLNIAAKCSPFISGKIGYNINFSTESAYYIKADNEDYSNTENLIYGDSGLFYNVTAGVRLRLQNHIGLNLGLSIYPSTFQIRESTDFERSPKLASYSRLNFGLNIGFDF